MPVKHDYQFSGRLFYRLYIALIICIVVIGSGLEYLAHRQDEVERMETLSLQYERFFLLIDWWLNTTAGDVSSLLVKQLNAEDASPFQVYSLLDFSADGETLSILKNGDVLPLFNANDQLSFYKKIGASGQVLAIEHPEWIEPVSDKRWLSVIFYLLVGLTLFVLIMPFSKQLLKIKKASIDFGKGDLSSRIPLPANKNLSPIVQAFNSMADRIERLLLAQRDLSHSVSHELRTPLARLKFGFEEINSLTQDNHVSHIVAGLQEDVRELEGLVDELLRYAEISEVQSFKQAEVPLRAFIDGLIQSVHSKEINVRSVFHDGVSQEVKLWCNDHHLNRALSNVIRNAVSFAKTTCEVHVRQSEEGIVICIEDDGVGLDEAHAKRIFEPFYRVKSAEGHQGYGLGLAIAYNITSKHVVSSVFVKVNCQVRVFVFCFPILPLALVCIETFTYKFAQIRNTLFCCDELDCCFIHSNQKRMSMKSLIHVLMLVFMATAAYAGNLKVSGQATVSHASDQAVINASITSSHSSAKAAFSKNSEAMLNLQQALEKFGVQKNQLETNQFSFYPKYRWIDNNSVFDGYAVTHTLLINTQQMAQLGELLDVIVGAGATQVNSVTFNNANVSELREQALKAAVLDAEKQAKLLAKSTGVVLGQVVSIQADPNHQSEPPMPMMANAEMSSNMEIIPGNKQITATVVIEYTIE